MKKLFLLLFLSFITLPKITKAQSGNALAFDGVNDYVNIPHHLYFTYLSSYTMECWIKPTSFNSLAGLISKNNSNGSSGFTLRLSETAPYTGINFDGMTTANGILSANQWYHIAAVNNNGTRSLYINGVLQNLTGTAINYNSANTDRLTLGVDNIDGTPRYFKGTIETARLISSAISKADIIRHMNMPDRQVSGFVFNFQFNQGVAGGNNSGITTLINSVNSSPLESTLINFNLSGQTSNWVSTSDWSPATYILYVNAAATGSNNGSSWANAFTSLKSAIDLAYRGARIWVAKGIYKPTDNTNRDISFTIQSGVKLYGGFAGNETTLESRNWQLNETILSGNIGNTAIDNDNSYHVVKFPGVEAGTTISGFCIRDGNANVSGNKRSYGGGIINQSELRYPTGSNSNSSPTIEYCKIINNNALEGGSGIYSTNEGSDISYLTIIQCVIAKNYVNGGGAISVNHAVNNSGLENRLDLTNCTIAYNSSANSILTGGLNIIASNTQRNLEVNIKNSIVWANDVSSYYLGTPNLISLNISFSDIEGKGNSGTNLDADPKFTNPDNDDFTISNGCSPVVNSGTNTNIAFAYDLNHNPRIRAGSNIIDMGAYEYYGEAGSQRFYVKPMAAGNKKGYDWKNAISFFPGNTNECTVREVWVAAGTYKPTADNDRTISFMPISGVKYYGGFSGNETSLEQRNWAINKTILSGDIGNLKDSLDNSYCVVKFIDATNATLLDGFVIRDGNSISEGGGIRNVSNINESSPTIANCIITNNNATNIGGGVYHANVLPTMKLVLINTAIYGNSAGKGGGIGNKSSLSPTQIQLINCTIAHNRATTEGGGIINISASNVRYARDSIFNSIIWGNTAPSSPNIHNNGAGAAFSAFYSNIEGETPNDSQKLINVNPQFANPTIYDYTPQACNASTDSGYELYLSSKFTIQPNIDILGNKRIRYKIDMGAYEYMGPTIHKPTIVRQYVKKTATGKNNGSSWDDAFTELFYITDASCSLTNEVWIAANTYTPTLLSERASSFELKNNIKFYGGFVGNESTLESRNWLANPTILSGNIGNAPDITDNSYHVVRICGNKALLDGFTIQDGYAGGASLDFEHKEQSGGGILIMAAQDTTDLTVRNCIIKNNESMYGGGGIAHYGLQAFAPSSLKVYGSLLSNNKSAQGAAIYHYAVASATDTMLISTQLTNCTISRNTSDIYGTGGLYYVTLGNQTKSEFKVNNSIIWDNPSEFNTQIDIAGLENDFIVANTNIQNNRFTGTNVLDVDPQFNTNAFTLKESSPCRNIGDNALATIAALTKDLGFNDRLTNLKVDLGAYEGNQICLSNQNLSQTFNNGTLIVQDGRTLTSTSKMIPISNTTFDAKSAIVLQPGFAAGGNGVVFTAQIGGCN